MCKMPHPSSDALKQKEYLQRKYSSWASMFQSLYAFRNRRGGGREGFIHHPPPHPHQQRSSEEPDVERRARSPLLSSVSNEVESRR